MPMAPALSPARNASRPISSNSCARSIALPLVAQPLEARRKASAGALAIAGLPMQPADLAVQARGARAIRSRLQLLAHRLVVCERLASPSAEREQIGEPLAHRLHLAVAALTVRERAQGAFVVADRVIVSVDGARPVAGGHQVARAPALVGREAPVVAKRFQVAQPLRLAGRRHARARGRPARATRSACEQEIAVHDLVHERVREPVTAVLALLARST